MVVLLNKMMSFYYILFCSEWIRFLIFYILQIDEFRIKNRIFMKKDNLRSGFLADSAGKLLK
ncbi:hypothetical protein N597_00535 [Streptococcus ilei]|jgi:hypothetical protein|nr:hypothetical protein N597_00535 [Streptococcus ilei]